MCGIIGVIREGAAEARDRLVVARDLMWHRGPDDAGLWCSNHACIGARRLSIIDLSAAGHQPMVSTDGTLVLVFNGEIYNHRELRRELEPGCVFTSSTDFELLLHGYRRWGGEGLVRRLDGMFAFAIWDETTRTLFAARDRAGKKPFFFRRDGRTMQFASTLNALSALLPGTPDVDPAAIDAFLVYQSVPAPLSVFRGVQQLEPAHFLEFQADRGDCRIARYWSVSYAHKTTASEDEVVAQTDALVRTAVRRRLESDVPVGIFLSGGVDSSLIAALAAQESSRDLEAVTLGFDEPEFDERRYARAVTDGLGMRLHEETLRPALVADLPSIVWHYGQPLADVSIVPNHYLAQAARRWMTVALNGDGGDELFGGYARPMLARATAPYRATMPESWRRGLAAAVGMPESGPFRRVGMFTNAGAGSASESFVYSRAFRDFRLQAYPPEFLATLDGAQPDDLYRAVWDAADGVDDVDRALEGDFRTYLPDQLLAKADRASMAHSLEARSPLLDRALIEYAATIPTSIRLRGYQTKHVLKAVAERYVPSFVLHRPKRGFVMPASRWLRGELAPYVRAALDNRTFYDRGWVRPEFVRRVLAEHFTGVRDWGEQIWTMLVLEVWARLVLDRSLDRDARMDAFLQRPGRALPAPVRTLQIGMEWFPEKPGGLNRVYYELMRHLPDVNVEVHGLVAGTDRVARDSNGNVEAFASYSGSLAPRLLAARRLGQPLLRANPDLVVVSHFALYTAPLLDSIGGHPLVVHFQGPWGLEGKVERQSEVVVRTKSTIEQKVYARADSFIVLSPPFADILVQQFGVSREKIHVIPGGVDVPRYDIAESREACRERLGWPADRPIVLTVRRLMRRMGLDNLIAATLAIRAQIPDILVLVAGGGPIQDELHRQIVSLGLEANVRLLGFLPDNDLPAAYRAASLTVVPTQALEGFGLIVAESLAAGTPCLVTPVGGLTAAVEKLSEQLILKGTDSASIADGVIGALTGTLPLPDAAACLDFARRNYDWPVIASQVRTVYEAAQR